MRDSQTVVDLFLFRTMAHLDYLQAFSIDFHLGRVQLHWGSDGHELDGELEVHCICPLGLALRNTHGIHIEFLYGVREARLAASPSRRTDIMKFVTVFPLFLLMLPCFTRSLIAMLSRFLVPTHFLLKVAYCILPPWAC
jgi:hypothetical protein